MRTSAARITGAVALSLCGALAQPAELRLEEGTNLSASVRQADGDLAIDLLGAVWQVPARGGDAELLVRQLAPAAHPRWSPDGGALLYETAGPAGSALWLLDVESRNVTRLTPEGRNEQDAAWHPSGERIVFSAAGESGGIDIHERDLRTGLDWRLTSAPGDESDPAWSADGRHLVYVQRDADGWQLVLRPFGQPPRVLLQQASPIHAPAWRPDNTLITYLARDESGQLALRMTILSSPPLERTLVSGEDLFIAPVSWRGRDRFVYTADGAIKTRHFEDRESRRIPFSAAIDVPRQRRERAAAAQRPLPETATRSGRFVVRAPRVFDGTGGGYRRDTDIVVENGRIVAVEPRRERPDDLIFDIGDVTVTPGLIDTYARLPDATAAHDGPLVLGLGVTTLVTPDEPAFDVSTWQDEALPGPRVLRALQAGAAPGRAADADRADVRVVAAAGSIQLNAAQRDRLQRWRSRGVPLLAENWHAGLAIGADLLLGSAALPYSPRGVRYADINTLANGGPLLLVSAAADAATPGLQALTRTPPAERLNSNHVIPRRFLDTPRISNGSANVIVGSRPSLLPPGIATQAELLALHAAGMTPERVLLAATAAAADALQLHGELGRIEPGARADLLLIAGDPLARLADMREVVAVVKDGRFYSVAALVDAVDAAVE